MSALEKVVSIGVGEIFKQIENFLNNKSYKSNNTSQGYQRGIKRFFEIVKDKQLYFLTKDDVQITFDDLEHFVATMKEFKDEKGKPLNNKTINHYVSSVAELLRYLNTKKLVSDISCLSALKMIRLPENDNEYGVLTVEEVWDFAKWVKENELKLADVKYYFILFSLDTCLRKGAVLKLTWDDFDVREGKVYVKAIDKGNKDFRGLISLEFYNQILELKEKYNADRVFKIGSTTLQEMLDRWKESRNIAENRNIVLHSVRKAGATYQFRITGDLLQAKKALGHSNLTTTQKYLGTEDYGIVGAVSSGNNIDPELYKKVSKEELIKAIEGIVGYSTMINLKLNDILNE